MTFTLLTEHHLKFLSLKGGCTGSSESKFIKMPHCLKSYVETKIMSRIQIKLVKFVLEADVDTNISKIETAYNA